MRQDTRTEIVYGRDRYVFYSNEDIRLAEKLFVATRGPLDFEKAMREAGIKFKLVGQDKS